MFILQANIDLFCFSCFPKADEQASDKEIEKMDQGAIDLCKQFDKDGNGYISKDELKQALGNSLSSKEIDDLMKSADENHDGKVNYETQTVYQSLYVNVS